MFKTSVMAGIGGLILMGISVPQTLNAQSGDECKGKKSDRPAYCGGDETTGGEHRSLTVTFDDNVLVSNDLQGDDSDIYSDSEKTVEATLGGQAQPNKPGFVVSLKKKGRDFREITGHYECQALPGGLNNCDLLPDGLVGSVTDDTMALRLRPYEVNCPETLPGGECPDVFTMDTGSTELMSFRINFWNQGVFFEVASAIGGAGSLNPGRCLSLLPEAERNAFVQKCDSDEYTCDVSVEAFDNGFSGTGVSDGENDEWRVDAVDVTALLCILQSGYETVYGMTTMTFGVHAIKE